jgi:Zn2+/Cd2+-exporting ATPase
MMPYMHSQTSRAHHHHCQHDHADNKKWPISSEMTFSFLSGFFLLAGFLVSLQSSLSIVSVGLYVVSYFFGGFYTTKESYESVIKGRFEIDFLMLVAAIGAATLGKWGEGALLLFLFSLGHALEHYAMAKAQKSISALSDLAPKTALLKVEGHTKEVPIGDLKLGDLIVVRPNTKIAADGVVVSGNGSVNQAPITGESVLVDKFSVPNPDFDVAGADKLEAKYKVFAGSINGNELLEVKVTKLASDSTIARLVKLVNEAQSQKSPTQHLADKIQKYYVPAVLVLVTALCFAFLVVDETFSESFYRAMSVLIAASPCALAISTPSAVLSGVARAARAGVLIKGGRPLEVLGTVDTLAFDKTGTLTEGKPRLTSVVAMPAVSEEYLLTVVVALETLSDHPLAKAIVKDASQRLPLPVTTQARDLEAILGKGVKARVENDAVYIGSLKLFEELDEHVPSKWLKAQVLALQNDGNTIMVVRKNSHYLGVLALKDIPRAEASVAMQQLKQVGIKRMLMLSGDNQQVADSIARQIGLTDAMGDLLPEQKVEAIQKLQAGGAKVAMVGDGVNDAPAMANSSLGIAMGAAGSDVALETADIALMGDKLSLLPFAIGLSKQANRIIKQNLVISMGMVAILVPLTLLGWANIGPAVIAHEGSTVLVVFNALRLLGYQYPKEG